MTDLGNYLLKKMAKVRIVKLSLEYMTFYIVLTRFRSRSR